MAQETLRENKMGTMPENKLLLSMSSNWAHTSSGLQSLPLRHPIGEAVLS